MTQAHVRVDRVWDMCVDSLHQIENDRAALMDRLVNERRWFHFRGFAIFPLPAFVGRRRITDVDHDIVRRHEAEEENKVMAILDLAGEVIRDNPYFRIYVSAEDYSILKKLETRYQRGEVTK